MAESGYQGFPCLPLCKADDITLSLEQGNCILDHRGKVNILTDRLTRMPHQRFPGQPESQTMESQSCHPGHVPAHHIPDPSSQPYGGAPVKTEDQNRLGTHPLHPEQIGNPMGNGSRFTGTGPRHDQHIALCGS